MHPAEGRRAVAGRTRPPVLRRHRQGRVQAAPAERNLTCDFPFWSMPQSLRVDSSAVPSARTGLVKLTTRSNGSAKSRTLSSGIPRTGRPAVRSSALRLWIGPVEFASPGDDVAIKPIGGTVAFWAGRREGDGCQSCLAILSAESRRLNFWNRRMPAECLMPNRQTSAPAESPGKRRCRGALPHRSPP